MNSKTHIILLGTFLTLIAAIIYVLNYFTPLASDDWNYVFIYGTNDKIHTLWDVIKSQYFHYFEMNGRITAHMITQTADGIFGKGVFNIANTLTFMAFLYLIGLNVAPDRKVPTKILLTAFVLTFLLIPEFNMAFLWLSGSCNYLWSATLILLFHYILGSLFHLL